MRKRVNALAEQLLETLEQRNSMIAIIGMAIQMMLFLYL